MKHIKGYKLFESSSQSEVIEYLKDIFRELEDNSFSIEVEKMDKLDFFDYWKGYTLKEIKAMSKDIHDSDINAICINISPENIDIKFKYSDVEDYIESAIEYMGTEWDVEFQSAAMYNPEVRPMRGIESTNKKGYLSIKPRSDDVLIWMKVLFIQKNDRISV